MIVNLNLISEQMHRSKNRTANDCVEEFKARNSAQLTEDSTDSKSKEQCGKDSLFSGFSLDEYIKNWFAMKGKVFSTSTIIQLSDLKAATLPLGIKWEKINVRIDEHDSGDLSKHNNGKEADITPEVKDDMFSSQANCLSLNMCKTVTSSISQGKVGNLFSQSGSQVTCVTSARESDNNFEAKSKWEKELCPTVCASNTYSFSGQSQSSQQGSSMTEINKERLRSALSATRETAKANAEQICPGTSSTTRCSFAAGPEKKKRRRKSPYHRQNKNTAKSGLPSDHPT